MRKTAPAGPFDRHRAGTVVVPSHSGDGATHSIDTLTTARDLEAAGIEREHAEAIATAIGYSDEQTASKAALRTDTKADLAALESRIDAKLAALRSEMRWMFGFQGTLILAMAAKLFGIV